VLLLLLPEFSMGPFCVTRFNPWTTLLQWTQPKQPTKNWKNLDLTRPNQTQPMDQPNPWTTLAGMVLHLRVSDGNISLHVIPWFPLSSLSMHLVSPLAISGNACPIFTNFFMHVTYGRLHSFVSFLPFSFFSAFFSFRSLPRFPPGGSGYAGGFATASRRRR